MLGFSTTKIKLPSGAKVYFSVFQARRFKRPLKTRTRAVQYGPAVMQRYTRLLKVTALHATV